ncbi:type 1 glutamine amidotransferase domain-containing protein [Cytophagaceae bacterium ABcell3]|nr:type 1 glutamine amidotransferase domain-containing protein [Cytophagaceae bacterium ABcell3]
MEKKLLNKNVAVLVLDGFEEIELTDPVQVLVEAGAKVFIISEGFKVKAWNKGFWSKEYAVDIQLDDANPETFNALLLPGGVMNPDKLRMNQKAVDFVKYFVQNKMPIGAICHGPWTLIETGLMKGRKLTSYPSIKTDLINAGANWTDAEVVVDQGLVTSRKPADLKAFNNKILEEFAEGPHIRDVERGPIRREKDIPTYAGNNSLNENIDDRNWGVDKPSDYE